MDSRIKKSAPKKIWIDLDNSPHVPFFVPIIKRLHESGCLTVITARDCFQVCGLADYHKMNYQKIGKHYGKLKIMKAMGTLLRAMQLLSMAVKAKPDIALSHGSRALFIVASLLKIPNLEITDYEFAYYMPFCKPDVIIVPEVISADVITGNNIKHSKYPGIKEDVYVPFFKPDAAIRNELKLGEDQIIVTIRPPATEAHYHNPESEGLFSEVLNMLGAVDNLKMVILPRNEITQTAWIKEKWPNMIASGKILIPSKVVDGLNLIWYSDFVVSGGGTMNREAAALGVPVYSIFRGKIGAVDRYLVSNNRLVLLESIDDIRKKIEIRKRIKGTVQNSAGSPALESILSSIDALLNSESATSL
jgi:uncharacterized protein